MQYFDIYYNKWLPLHNNFASAIFHNTLYLHHKNLLANYLNSENFYLKIIRVYNNYKFQLIFMDQGFPQKRFNISRYSIGIELNLPSSRSASGFT